MLKKTVHYVNFNNEPREKVLYFNLSEPEQIHFALEFEEYGGLEAFVNGLNPQENPQELIEFFEKLLRASYGEKSPDGEKFNKEGVYEEFEGSAAYNALYMELLTNEKIAEAFVNGLMSSNLRQPTES